MRRPRPALASRPIARLAQFAGPFAAISSVEACGRSDAAPVPVVLLTQPTALLVAPREASTKLGPTPCQAPSLVATPAPPPRPVARAVPHIVPNGPGDPLRHDPFKHDTTAIYGGTFMMTSP